MHRFVSGPLPTVPNVAVAARRRVAVVGADGFIGRRLSAALTRSGAQVVGYTRQHELYWPDDRNAPQVVCYLASRITPALAEQHPEWVTADRLRFEELVRRLARSERPTTVVLTSSAGTVYDPDVRGPCAEHAPTRATSRYGAAKLALEQLLLEQEGTLTPVVLRLSNVYGPGQRVGKSQGVLAYWLRSALRGEPVVLLGDPLATRDYVYVDDVMDCMLRVAATGRPPRILNVAAGVSTSLAELLATVETVVGHQLPVTHLPHRAVDRHDIRLDVRAAADSIGWRPATALVDGVAAMWRELARTREKSAA